MESKRIYHWAVCAFVAFQVSAFAQMAVGQQPPECTVPVEPATSETDLWKLQDATLEQQPLSLDETKVEQEEQEPGWSGGLIEETRNEQPAEELPNLEAQRPPGFRLRLGPVEVRPLIRLSTTYDDNIFIENSNQKGDLIHVLSPGFIVGVADYRDKKQNYASLTYVPSLILFLDHSGINSVDHHLLVDGQYAFSRLTTGGYFQYEKLSGADRDAAGWVNRNILTSALEASYQISEKTSVDMDGVLWIRDYEDEIDSQELINHNWFNYHFTPKVNAALGVAFGALEPDSADSNQTYQQALVRLRYESTAKLTFNGNVGVEIRQFDSEVGDRATPVFGLGAIYKLSEDSLLRLSAARFVVNSPSTPGENYVSTSILAGITQHIWRDIFLDLEGGYERCDYEKAGVGGGGTRLDNYFFFRPSLNYRLKETLVLSAFYFRRENDSNLEDRSFRNNQVGLELTIGF